MDERCVDPSINQAGDGDYAVIGVKLHEESRIDIGLRILKSTNYINVLKFVKNISG